MQIIYYILVGIAVLFALSCHEYAHAVMAFRLGDDSQRYRGRLTLNPLAHLDPVGTLLLFLVHFGWARPVQIDPRYFKNYRRSILLVGLAGPICNIFLAIIMALPWRLGFADELSPLIGLFLRINVQINLGLAAFNLIPIPPLDGSKVLVGILPGRLSYKFEILENYGTILLILLIATGASGIIMGPIMSVLNLIAYGNLPYGYGL